MFKTRYLISAVIFIPWAAHATEQDGFPIPTDIEAVQGPYVEKVPTYAAGTTRNAPIDPTVTPPPAADLFTNLYPTAETADKVDIGDKSSAFCLVIAEGGTCQEPKFRTEADVMKIAYNDPIRNFKEPGQSHCHQFFGNAEINSDSTFQSLREQGGSFARGGDLNNTGYWFPCPFLTDPTTHALIAPFGDGKYYAVRADHIIIYYQESEENADISTYIPPGLRYVLGSQVDDPFRTRMQGFVDAANAQPGTSSTRYRLSLTLGGTDYLGKPSYYCSGATPQVVDLIVNPDGSDPHAGTCTTGMEYNFRVSGGRCWDGDNLWSPGGYFHVIDEIWDTQYSEWVCPTNYYRIPGLQLQIKFTQTGFADRERWRLSSDDMYDTVAGSAQGNGASFHTDWMYGWNTLTMRKWLDGCIGVEGGISHECNGSTISATEELKNVNVNPSDTYGTASANLMFQLPSQQSGPNTIHVHGN